MEDRETTGLDRWRALARIENALARQARGFQGKGGWSGDPATLSPLTPRERAVRNQQIRILAGTRHSMAEIARRTGLSRTMVRRILRRRADTQ